MQHLVFISGALLILKKVTALVMFSGFLLIQGNLLAEDSPNAEEQPSAPNPAPAIAPTQPAHAILPGEPGSTQDKRIAGILPNYRTADSTQAYLPLTVGQKWKIATKDTIDYPSYVLAMAFASISQLNNSNPSFGQGLKGYGKRYAAGIADQDIGNFMTEAIYSTLLHEDPRYFRKVNGTKKSRFLWAVERIVVTRTDSGGSTFNFSEWLGNGTVAAIGNSYYRDERGFNPTMQRMFTQIGTDTISDVLKEFWPDIKRHFTKKSSATEGAD